MGIFAGIVLIGGFAVLMCLKVPVSFAMLLSTLGSAAIMGTNFSVMVRQMVDGANNFSLLSIPFFIVMGEFMGAGGISEKIVDLANLAVGRFRGGLAYVNVLDSMFFGGISGSAVADVSSLGSMVIPMMKKQGYDEDFAVGLTVCTACQGVLIPPSHNMVIYALAAGGGVSIGTLFMAGMLPGVLLGVGMMIMCFFMAKRYNFPKGEGVPKGEGIKILLRGILPMMTLVIIMVGTGMGIFTATESSAIACVYTIVLAMVVFRTVKIKDVPGILKASLKTLCVVMTLLATAKAFAYMMTELRIPDAITAALAGVTDNRYVLLLIINILLLVLGCFMDMAPLITIMTPILLPVVTNPVIGVDPIHFGVMMIFNLAVGLCTPPVGSALFVGCAIGKTPIERTAKNMLPLYAVMVIVLLLVTYIPDIALLLPRLVMGYAG
ncbi:MAG: TRAP transporter large permease [Clostridia bacterium]|nr:TRAP transporter large permease [Clostridia bacterium]